MPEVAHLLSDPFVREVLRNAWKESRPGPSGGHEEGGFILVRPDGQFNVARWPRGQLNSIIVPEHSRCRYDGLDIAASYHTHPTTRSDFIQEPGETDKRSVRDDPHLKGTEYVGEFIVSREVVYLIDPTGRVSQVAMTDELFDEA